MNLTELIGKIKDELNKSDCGVCWRTVLGGRRDYLNLAKVDCKDECCAMLGVLRARDRSVIDTNDVGVEIQYNEWMIDIFAGIPSRLDIQFYDEIDECKKDESKWEKYLYPMKCCLKDLPILFCDMHNCKGGSIIEVTRFETEMRLNYLDNNYDGWMINATFREYADSR